VFTTRPDTLWGVSYLALAPEHPLVASITTPAQQAEVAAYVDKSAKRSERDRLADVKTVSGCFTGAYALHPFTGQPLPVWIADYVLVGYGTGAVMAVPAHDSRDHRFAKHFDLPIIQVIETDVDVQAEAYEGKTGNIRASDFITGLEVQAAITHVCAEAEARGIGKAKITWRLRDAIFSRQRYWGEPIPIVYRNGIPTPVPEDQLPVTLPEVQSYKPTGTGESPLAAVTDWVQLPDGSTRETDTMPGWAGSSWYFMRYLDPTNAAAFAEPGRLQHWLPVDLYLGGAEHAVGHLLYARFWTHFLHDLGHCPVQEPFTHLVNQGMIQGVRYVYFNSKADHYSYYSADHPDVVANRENFREVKVVDINPNDADTIALIRITHDGTDINILEEEKGRYIKYGLTGDISPLDNDRKKIPHTFTFHTNKEHKFTCEVLIEKMSKSLGNVVNPDDICKQYGADTFRMYEMFLGPLEQHKPWSTQGINGVFSFLRRTWNLFLDEQDALRVTDAAPTPEELKVLHQTIKKTQEDIERLSFNTAVSQFMICTNELTRLACHKRAILEPLLQSLAPFAPHFAEELWHKLGHSQSIFASTAPTFNPEYLVENSFEYPVSVNGKLRFKLELPLDLSQQEVTDRVLAAEDLQKFLSGGAPKKVIVVPGKIVNVVV
jgi:leucyl-tRNA synthetase